MDIFQENIDNQWKIAPPTIQFVEKVLPLVFYYDYDSNKTYENGNRVIAPKSLLYKLSEYDNLKYPIHFKFKPSVYKKDSDYKEYIYSIYEYIDDIDHIYLPNEIYRDIDVDVLIEYDNQLEIDVINYDIPKAESIILKPFTSNFLSIKDPKTYLEAHLKKHYTILFKDQIITTIFGKSHINIQVVDVKPENQACILETEVNVDFEAPHDYIDPATLDPSIKPRNKPKEEKKDDNNISQRFPGKGNRLGGN